MALPLIAKGCPFCRHIVVLALVAQISESRVRIKVRDTRGHTNAIAESEFGSKNRIDHQIGERAASDAAPIVHVRKIIRTLICRTAFEREGGLDEVCLTDWTLISSLGEILQPRRHSR